MTDANAADGADPAHPPPSNPQALARGAWLLLVAALVVYAPALRGGFVWDDVGFVVQNRLLDRPDALRVHWLTTLPADYWPVSYTALWLLRRLFGFQVVAYHLCNVLLHATCGTLVWRIARSIGVRGAWFVGLLFVVHPANVQAVAWMFQIKTLLAAVGFFASLLSYRRFDVSGRRRWWWVALGGFVFALLAKSSPVMLPAVLLLYRWAVHGRLTRADLARVLPFAVVALAAGLVGGWFQRRGILADAAIEHFTPAARFGQVGRAAAFYLRIALAPIGLHPIYAKWTVEHAGVDFYAATAGWTAGLVLLASVAESSFARLRRAGRVALVATAYFLVVLFPALGAVGILYFYVAWVADHYLYLALPAVIAPLVHGASVLVSGSRARLLAAASVTVIVGSLTFHQAAFWSGSVPLWERQVALAPDEWQGRSSLAAAYADQGRWSEALPQAERAVALAPTHGSAHAQLGDVYRHLDRTDAAVEQFDRATAAKPPVVSAYVSLGEIAAAQGRPDEAERLFRSSVDVARSYYGWPGYAPAEMKLGQVCFDRRDVRAAIAWWADAVEQEPGMTEAQNNLGLALLAAGRDVEAIPHLERALAARPDLAATRRLLERARAGSRL